MAALSPVVMVDGFQHGAVEPFQIRCMAVACGRTSTTYTRHFDTTDLLGRPSAAIWTYRCQTEHHGLSISSAGLPRDLAGNVLFHAIQENLLELLEEGKPTPNALILWTNGTTQRSYIHSLINGVGLPIPFLVRNLDEVGCPPIRQLSSDLGTSSKAKVLAKWLMDNALDDHAIVRNCN